MCLGFTGWTFLVTVIEWGWLACRCVGSNIWVYPIFGCNNYVFCWDILLHAYKICAKLKFTLRILKVTVGVARYCFFCWQDMFGFKHLLYCNFYTYKYNVCLPYMYNMYKEKGILYILFMFASWLSFGVIARWFICRVVVVEEMSCKINRIYNDENMKIINFFKILKDLCL